MRVAGQSCLASPSVLQLAPCSEASGNIVQEEQDERNLFCSASYIIVTLQPHHQSRRHRPLITIPMRRCPSALAAPASPRAPRVRWALGRAWWCRPWTDQGTQRCSRYWPPRQPRAGRECDTRRHIHGAWLCHYLVDRKTHAGSEDHGQQATLRMCFPVQGWRPCAALTAKARFICQLLPALMQKPQHSFVDKAPVDTDHGGHAGDGAPIGHE